MRIAPQGTLARKKAGACWLLMATEWFPSGMLFGAEGWWEAPAPRGGRMGRPRACIAAGGREVPLGWRETGAAFLRNPRTANSLRRKLFGRWVLGPFGKLSLSAAGNPPWESAPGRLQSCKTREARAAWEIQSSALPSTLDGSPALISLHLSRATKPLPQPSSPDPALVSPALQGHPVSHRPGPDRLNSPNQPEKATCSPKATSSAPCFFKGLLHPSQRHICSHQRLSQCPFLAPVASSGLFWMSPFTGDILDSSAQSQPPPVHCATWVERRDLGTGWRFWPGCSE